MNTASRTTVIMNYVLLTICAIVAIYPLVGVFLASLYPPGTDQRAVGVRTAADLRVAQLRRGLGAGEVRLELPNELHRRSGDGARLGAPVRRRRVRVRDDAVPRVEDDLLPVHPRADHPDRGDDRAPLLRRAGDGAARHLLGADHPRDRRARSRSGSSGCAPRSWRPRSRCSRRPGSTVRTAGRRSGAIMVPFARPAILTLTVLCFADSWNEFFLAPGVHDQPHDRAGGARELLGSVHARRRAGVGGGRDRRDPDPDRVHLLPAGVPARDADRSGEGVAMADVTYKSVRKEFGEVVALKDFSLQIPDGEFVVLVGPSGSGKTTALRLLAGLEAITDGEIRVGDAPREPRRAAGPRHRDGLPGLRAVSADDRLRQPRVRPQDAEDPEAEIARAGRAGGRAARHRRAARAEAARAVGRAAPAGRARASARARACRPS